MIRHDDEPIQEERIQGLDAVQTFDGFTGMCRFCKDRRSTTRIGGNHHQCTVLDRMPLEHVIMKHRARGGALLLGNYSWSHNTHIRSISAGAAVMTSEVRNA